MTTFGPLQQNDSGPISDGCQTGSSARHPARTPAAPTPAARASTGSAPDCSSRQSDSSASADLLGAALRTSLASELAALTGCSPSWKLSATPAGRSWWVLSMPARRTGDSGCGSLLPTCRVSQGAYTRDGKTKRARLTLEGIVLGKMLPTPTARDWRSGKASEATFSKNSRPLSEQLQRGAVGTVGLSVLLAVCEWLMGYPPGWIATASPGPAPSPRFRRRRGKRPSLPTETPSSRKSLKP